MEFLVCICVKVIKFFTVLSENGKVYSFRNVHCEFELVNIKKISDSILTFTHNLQM